MPDIAELRTLFTADDSDFRATYRRVSAALAGFQSSDAAFNRSTAESARRSDSLSASLSKLTSEFQRLTVAERAGAAQAHAESLAIEGLNKSISDSIALSLQLTSAREKAATATRNLAKAEAQVSDALSQLDGKGKGVDEKGKLGKLREAFHQIAELADDIDKTKNGFNAVSEIASKFKTGLGGAEVAGAVSEVGESAAAASTGMAALVAEAGPYLLAVAAVGGAVWALKAGWDALVHSGIQSREDIDEQIKKLRGLESAKGKDLERTIQLVNQAKHLQSAMGGNAAKTQGFIETLTKIGALHPELIAFDKLGNAIGFAANNQALLNQYTQNYSKILQSQHIEKAMDLYKAPIAEATRRRGIAMQELRDLRTNGLLQYKHGDPNSQTFSSWASSWASASASSLFFSKDFAALSRAS